MRSPSIQKEQQPGVAKIEALHRVFGKGAFSVWWLYVSIGLMVYAYSLDGSTTSNYLAIATSAFDKHAVLSTITTAENIITAVGKPPIAKIADVTSRSTAYAAALFFYVLGYIVVASANNVAALGIGMILYTIGKTGLDLVSDILIADLSPLKWRGLMTSFASSPFIVNAFISAQIVDGVLDHAGWRWGYGMFAIIMPAIIAPALVVLFWADHKAKVAGTVAFGAAPIERRLHAEKVAANTDGSTSSSSDDVKQTDPAYDELRADPMTKLTFIQKAKYIAEQLDLIGLLLLGMSFALMLLPITLAKSARHGWKNPSILAMICCGVVIFVLFVLWERFGTKHPLMPKRILMNKVFLCAVGIDMFYFMSGSLRSLYLSSYTYIVQDFSNKNWVYFGNTQSLALCIFGIFAGIWLRYTHRYKYLQISGLCIRILGMGLTIHARKELSSMAELVWTQILIGMGGAFSVVGSRVASQASVPHQDLATVIALLSLWTQLGSSVGSAIAGGIWTNTMPQNLKNNLPGVPQATINKIYGNIRAIKTTYPRGTAIRAGVTRAYEITILPMLIAALVISFLPLIFGLLMTNYYLGDTQNAVDGTGIDGLKIAPDASERDPRVTPAHPEAEAHAAGSLHTPGSEERIGEEKEREDALERKGEEEGMYRAPARTEVV